MPLMRQYRLRQQQLDPALYELHPDAEQRFHRWVGQMAQDPRSRLLVAEERGQIIGFLYATMETDAPIYLHDEFALVREWWVEASFRRQGAGKALIDLAAAELAAAGVRQLRVRTAAPDRDAHALLQRCGFRPGASELVMDLRTAP
jgi:L-amino acid N-acyltransferase YncA